MKPADAQLLESEALNGYESGDYFGDNESARIIAARFRALAAVLRTITPAVVYEIGKAADNEIDAADSSDAPPHARYHELRAAEKALASLLTDEQRHQLRVAS